MTLSLAIVNNLEAEIPTENFFIHFFHFVNIFGEIMVLQKNLLKVLVKSVRKTVSSLERICLQDYIHQLIKATPRNLKNNINKNLYLY